ncbi:MAG: thioredoxin [Bacteroidetes bacterium]|nr:thioredoxin [Bacteroidota bacterium]
MKKIIIISFALAINLISAAQNLQQPQKQNSQIIPPIHLLKQDSSGYYTNNDIKKHRETLIMYFSPECDHCKHQTEDIIKDMGKFGNIQIVMATYFPLNEIKEFYRHYKIASYHNIIMGRDEQYSIPPHYNMHSFPFLALYDKKGNLITVFEGNQKTATLLEAFKKAIG